MASNGLSDSAKARWGRFGTDIHRFVFEQTGRLPAIVEVKVRLQDDKTPLTQGGLVTSQNHLEVTSDDNLVLQETGTVKAKIKAYERKMQHQNHQNGVQYGVVEFSSSDAHGLVSSSRGAATSCQ